MTDLTTQGKMLMRLRNATTTEPVTSTSSEMEWNEGNKAEAVEIQVDPEIDPFDFGEELSSTQPESQVDTFEHQPESAEEKGIDLDSGVGVNMRVSQWDDQGNRPYMEDTRSVLYQPTADGSDVLYAFYGVFDGHGGPQASVYVRDNLCREITSQELFWSQDDNDVLEAINLGFRRTHHQLWAELGKLPQTYEKPCTAGTTATVCFVRRRKLFIGHVGDSALVLGCKDDTDNNVHGPWMARQLTKDHKPSDEEEQARIEAAGGQVVRKSNVSRVVWKRPVGGYDEPLTESTVYQEQPFLAVARSLGDLWSYNRVTKEYLVSPVPDVMVYEIDPARDKCLILASDGLWNVIKPQQAINMVRNAVIINSVTGRTTNHPRWENPSRTLTEEARLAFRNIKYPADNITVVTILFPS